MTESQRIFVSSIAAGEHVTSISGHSSPFDATIPSATVGTATAITEADDLGGEFSSLSGRYAAALPNSANMISIIAERLRNVDRASSTAVQGLGGGSGGGAHSSHHTR